MDLKRKYEKISNDSLEVSSLYEEEIPDTIGIALLFSEYTKSAGIPRTELDNETVDLVYLAMEHHLKDVMACGLEMLSNIQSTSKKKKRKSTNSKHQPQEASCHTTTKTDSNTQTGCTLTGSALKLSQRINPFVYGEDILSLDFFNL